MAKKATKTKREKPGSITVKAHPSCPAGTWAYSERWRNPEYDSSKPTVETSVAVKIQDKDGKIVEQKRDTGSVSLNNSHSGKNVIWIEYRIMAGDSKSYLVEHSELVKQRIRQGFLLQA